MELPLPCGIGTGDDLRRQTLALFRRPEMIKSMQHCLVFALMSLPFFLLLSLSSEFSKPLHERWIGIDPSLVMMVRNHK